MVMPVAILAPMRGSYVYRCVCFEMCWACAVHCWKIHAEAVVMSSGTPVHVHQAHRRRCRCRCEIPVGDADVGVGYQARRVPRLVDRGLHCILLTRAGPCGPGLVLIQTLQILFKRTSPAVLQHVYRRALGMCRTAMGETIVSMLITGTGMPTPMCRICRRRCR